jgi:uncharacterized protein (DUF1810 family)
MIWFLNEGCLLAELQNDPSAGHYVMLAARNRRNIIGRTPRVEVPHLAAEAHESPELHVDPAGVVERPVAQCPGCIIRTSVLPQIALFIESPSSTNGRIGGKLRPWKQFDADARRHIERCHVACRGRQQRGRGPLRTRQQVHFAIEPRQAAAQNSASIIRLQGKSAVQGDPRAVIAHETAQSQPDFLFLSKECGGQKKEADSKMFHADVIQKGYPDIPVSDFQHFIDAQNAIYEKVCSELRAGSKRTHWMWFIFPQLKGLGVSPTAYKFGIASKEQASEFLQHALLGSRLRECTELVNQLEDRTVEQIFGYPDDLKFRSCMTLFAQVDGPDSVFQAALEKYFGGEPDARTLDLLK